MANKDTLKIKPIADLIKRHLTPGSISIDPFARNCQLATYTNDLNPNTKAQHHMDALAYLQMLLQQGVRADVILFDPPYNPAQAKQCYEEIGFKLPQRTAQTAGAWPAEKDIAMKLLKPDGVFIWLGWNTCGMGKKRGFAIKELLLVEHGRGKHCTLCMVEQRQPQTLRTNDLKPENKMKAQHFKLRFSDIDDLEFIDCSVELRDEFEVGVLC